MPTSAKALTKRLIEIPEMRRIQHLHFVGIGAVSYTHLTLPTTPYV